MFTSRPNWPICNVCGQQFSKHSIEIHRRQCIVKYEQQLIQQSYESISNSKIFGVSKIKTKNFIHQDAKRKTPNSNLVQKNNSKPEKIPIGQMSKSTKSSNNFSRGKLINMPFSNSNKIVQNVPESKLIPRKNGQYSSINSFGDLVNQSNIISLRKCQFCERNFSFDRIQKHESVCIERKGKRRSFNSTKQRWRDIDDLNISRPMKRTNYNQTRVNNKKILNSYHKSNWRQQHLEFQKSIREAKKWQQEQRLKKEYELAFSKNRPNLHRIDHPLAMSRSGLTAAIPSFRSSYNVSPKMKIESNIKRINGSVSRIDPYKNSSLNEKSTILNLRTSKSRIKSKSARQF